MFLEFVKIYDLKGLIQLISSNAMRIENKRIYTQARRFERIYNSIIESKEDNLELNITE